MRAAHYLLSIFLLLGASLAGTIPVTPVSIPTNSTRSLYEYGVPAPTAPYRMRQDNAFLTFYDYGAPLLPNLTRRLMLGVLRRIASEHRADYREEIGREVVYSLRNPAVGGALSVTLEPEANMTWGMFATAATGMTRFLERWDNVEFAVNVAMTMDGGDVGTAYLKRRI